MHVTMAIWEDARETMTTIGRWKSLRRRELRHLEIATSGPISCASQRAADRRHSRFPETSPIEHDLELVAYFPGLGVCIMQLTYNLQNFIGAGYWEERDTGISSRFGEKR